jgi:hypothetical protein
MIHNAIQNAYNNGEQIGFMWGITCGLFVAIVIKSAKMIMKDKEQAK